MKPKVKKNKREKVKMSAHNIMFEKRQANVSNLGFGTFYKHCA
jgi:hypothetical protein